MKKFFLLFILLSSSFSKDLTILHTNDLHSYFAGSLSKKGEVIKRAGGYDRLANEIIRIRDEERKADRFVLLVDAGDFYSGTIFHSIAMRAEIPLFPEYEFFNTLEYDAITLGNHEFDGLDNGFSLLMKKVSLLGAKVPIVSTNFKVPTGERFPVVTSRMITLKKGNDLLKVGILGALGPDGCSVSSGNRKDNQFIGFDDSSRKERWNELIDILSIESKALKKSGSEINVLLLHGGGEEDERLAKKVKFIDTIIAGHTHEVYLKRVNNVVISQAGHYGKYLGRLPLKLKNGSVEITQNGLNHIEINENTSKNEVISQRISFYNRFTHNILEELGVGAKGIRKFENDYLKTSQPSIGNFIADNILKEIQKKDSSISLYLTANGLIRNPIYKNYEYSSSDLFNIYPIGFHDGYHLGHRVVSFYLSHGDLLKLVEFMNIYSKFKKKATPSYSSNLSFEVRSWGIPFINRIKELKINSLRKEKLYHVATSSFLFSYLDLIKKKTFGVIEIVPKTNKGDQLETPLYHDSEIKYFLKGVSQEEGNLPL